jgi:hypothetical protein
MEWVLVAILGVLVVLFFWLYWKALSEGRALRNYALLVLLDEGVYAVQRKGLTDLVRSIEAKDAADLGFKVYQSLDRLAERLRNTMLGVNGLRWKLKTSGQSR